MVQRVLADLGAVTVDNEASLRVTARVQPPLHGLADREILRAKHVVEVADSCQIPFVQVLR